MALSFDKLLLPIKDSYNIDSLLGAGGQINSGVHSVVSLEYHIFYDKKLSHWQLQNLNDYFIRFPIVMYNIHVLTK